MGPVGVPLSVGLLLPVLISADTTATFVYRRHADWGYIFRLLPFFLIGTILGWWVFDFFQAGDDRVALLKVLVGSILLGMTGLHFLVQWRSNRKPKVSPEDANSTERPKGSVGLRHFFWFFGWDCYHAGKCGRTHRPTVSSGDGPAQVCFYRNFSLAFF